MKLRQKIYQCFFFLLLISIFSIMAENSIAKSFALSKVTAKSNFVF